MKNKIYSFKSVLVLGLLVLFNTFNSFANLSGSKVVYLGQEVNYQWSFSSGGLNPNGYATIVGGVFILPNNSTSSKAWLSLNTTLRVRWTGPVGKGKINTYFKFTPPAGREWETNSVYEVDIRASESPTNFWINYANNSELEMDAEYIINGSGAVTFDWLVTGDVAVKEKTAKWIKIRTSKTFKSCTIQYRAMDYANWSEWRKVALVIKAKPDPLSIDPEGNYVFAGFCPGEKKTFFVKGKALEYQWRISGDLSIIETKPNSVRLEAGSNFDGGTLSVRGKNTDWNDYTDFNISNKSTCTSSCDNTVDFEISTTLDDKKSICIPTKGTATVTGSGIDSIEWSFNNGCHGNYNLPCDPTETTSAGDQDINFITYNKDNMALYSIVVIAKVYYCNSTKTETIYSRELIGSKACKMAAGGFEVDELTSEELTIYPNPAKEVLNVKGCSNIKIMNSHGQVVKEFQGTMDALSLEGLTKGLYILHAEYNGKQIAKTFTIE